MSEYFSRYLLDPKINLVPDDFILTLYYAFIFQVRLKTYTTEQHKLLVNVGKKPNFGLLFF